MNEKLSPREVLNKIFSCKFKDIQPIKDDKGNIFITMNEETYKYLQEKN